MKYCSLCNREYADSIKICQLQHCPFCGSNKLQGFSKHFGMDTPILIFVMGFFSVLIITILLDKLSEMMVFLAMMVGFLIVILPSSVKSRHTFSCTQCLGNNFTPIMKIELADTKINNSQNTSTSDNIIKERLDSMRDEQKKHHEKIRTLRIVAVGVAITFGIVGLFFQELISEWVSTIIKVSYPTSHRFS